MPSPPADDAVEDVPQAARVLLISGSTRAASTNSALVRTAAQCAPPGMETVRYGLTALPHFNPDDDRPPLPHTVAALRHGIATSDAILLCTPEYAGTLPGSMKNLLDWTVGGTEMDGRKVAWVNASADPKRGHGAHETLQVVLGYLGARVVTDACRSVPVTREMIGPDRLIADASTREALRDVLSALVAA